MSRFQDGGRKIKTLGIVALFLALSIGNGLPEDVNPAGTESVPELETLRGRHDKAQESIQEDAQAKLNRINREYLESLDNLISQLTRQGKLASTLAVRAERNRLLSTMAGDAASKAKAEEGPHLERRSNRPTPPNSDYIYLCDLSVVVRRQIAS